MPDRIGFWGIQSRNVTTPKTRVVTLVVTREFATGTEKNPNLEVNVTTVTTFSGYI
jgi:hypothetical protein